MILICTTSELPVTACHIDTAFRVVFCVCHCSTIFFLQSFKQYHTNIHQPLTTHALKAVRLGSNIQSDICIDCQLSLLLVGLCFFQNNKTHIHAICFSYHTMILLEQILCTCHPEWPRWFCSRSKHIREDIGCLACSLPQLNSNCSNGSRLNYDVTILQYVCIATVFDFIVFILI